MLEVLFIFIFVFCCAFQLVRSVEQAAARRDDGSNQELATVRQNMSERRRSQHRPDALGNGSLPVIQPSAPPASADEEAQRDELIRSSMFSRKIDRSESVRSVENILKVSHERFDANKKGNVIARSYRAATSSVRTMGERECCICLDVYEPGETISWAKSDKCDHIFHQECAQEWLRTHDDCPLCRTKIINAEA